VYTYLIEYLVLIWQGIESWIVMANFRCQLDLTKEYLEACKGIISGVFVMVFVEEVIL
jgi:hypothetical protein